MKKMMIINKNSGSQGKTQSLKAVYKAFQDKYPSMNPTTPLEGEDEVSDTKAIFTIKVNGKLIRIGLESQGDPNSRQRESLTEFAKAECDIILGACRTRGDTLQNIWKIARKYKYRLIFASNYTCNDSHEGLKKLYVESIMKMVEEVIDGRI